LNGRSTDSPGSPLLAIGVLLVFGAVLSSVYFGRFVPASHALKQIASPAAACTLVLLAALAAGSGSVAAVRRLFVRAGAASPESTRTDLSHNLLVGVPILGTILGIVAWIGVALQATTLVLTLLLAAAGGLILLRSRPWPRWSPRAMDVALLAPPILIGFIGAITPVVSDDELVYKLALPHAYLLEGRMVELPLNTQNYFPASLSLPSLAALALSGGIAAKLVFFVVFLLALRTVYQFSKRLAPGGEAWLVAVVAWTPALLLIAGWCWPDWAMVALLLLSYEGWLRFRESRDAGDAAVLTLALAGALGGKYTALPWLLIFAPLAVWQMRRRSMPVLPLTLAAAATLVLFGGFFYFRNLAWTGSPIAPFLLAQTPRIGNFGNGGAIESWAELFHGDPVMVPSLVDDSLGILLPLSALLSPFALMGAGGWRRIGDLFVLSLLQFVGFVGFAPLWRYTLTALVPLALLGAAVCVRIVRESAWPLRVALQFGAALALAGQMLLVCYLLFIKYDFMPFLVGQESQERYLARKGYVPRAYAWIAQKLPAESRIFLIGENRPYYLERPSVWAGNQDGPRLSHYLARFPEGDAFGGEMRREGVTNILFDRQWYRVGAEGNALSRLEREVSLVVEPATDAMLRDFFATRAHRVYSDANYDLYELERSGQGASAGIKPP
jgi:hypothetical protein